MRLTRREPLPSAPGEEWLELPCLPWVLISTHGRAYDARRRRLLTRLWVEHRKAARGGSWVVVVHADGTRRTVPVAHWVLRTFRGEPSTGNAVPVYLNGDRRDARLDNLAWGPRSNRPAREHMARIAPMGYAASPRAQAATWRRHEPRARHAAR